MSDEGRASVDLDDSALTTIEARLSGLVEHLEGFQGDSLACLEIAYAIRYLEDAKAVLAERRLKRAEQGVMGTTAPHVS